MRFGRQVVAAALGASLVFGGVAAGVASLAPSAAAQEVTADEVMAGDAATVDVDFLNVRQTPSLSGAIVKTLAFGTPVSVVTGPVIADGYNWYRLQQNGAFIGWSVAGFLIGTGTPGTPGTPSGQFAFGSVVTINTDLLNVRSAPTTSASVLTTYAFGQSAVISGGPTTADGFTWYAVDDYGWVAGQYLIAFQSAPGPNPGPGTPTGDFAAGDSVFVNAALVNVRSGAGTSFGVAYTAAYGETFTIQEGPVVANGYEWYRISNLVSAWIAGDFLSLQSGSTPGNPGAPSDQFSFGQRVHVTTDLLNVRSAPSTSASILTVFAAGRQATISGGPTTADGIIWYAVDNLGWVASQYLGAGSGQVENVTLYVDVDAANVRSLPSTTGQVVNILGYGDIIEVFNGVDDANGLRWYAINSAETQWIADSVVTLRLPN